MKTINVKTGPAKIGNLNKLTNKVKGKQTRIVEAKFTTKDQGLAMIKSEALKEGNFVKEFDKQFAKMKHIKKYKNDQT